MPEKKVGSTMKKLKRVVQVVVIVVVGAMMGVLATKGVFFWADRLISTPYR